MTILVTTPNGKVGSEVIRLLAEQGVPVRIGAHTVEKAAQAFPGAEIVHFDYADAASVEAALAGVTALYFAAPGYMDFEPQARVLELAQAAGVKRVVRLSAMGVEQTDGALRRIEQMLEASAFEWTILRPTFFMQNFSTGSAYAIAHGTLAEPTGDGKTSFIDTRDIAAVAAKALTEAGHHGQIYVLTGARPFSRYEVAAMIGEAIGRPVQYIPLTDEQFSEGMKAYMSPAYIGLLLGIYGSVRAGWTEVVSEDVPKLLGRPAITLEQFVQDHRAVWEQLQPAAAPQG